QSPPSFLAFHPVASPFQPSEIGNEFPEGQLERQNTAVSPFLLTAPLMNARPPIPAPLPQVTIIILCLVTITLQPNATAAEGPTNEAAFSSLTFSAALNYYSKPSEVFVDRFFQEVGNSDSLIFDRLTGPA